MSDIYVGELQDEDGNTVYPHTEADVCFCTDGKNVQEKINNELLANTKVLKTMEEIEANTNPENIAGATALKQLNNDLNGYSFGETADGKPGYRKPGADTVTPFSKTPTIKTYNCADAGGGKSTAIVEKGRILDKNMFLLAAGAGNEGVVKNSVASSTRFGMWVGSYNPASGDIMIETGMSSVYYNQIHILYLD